MAQELKKDDDACETATSGCGMFNVFKKEFDNQKEESSCDGDNGEKKKKGLKEKIKEKISRKKNGENTNREKTNGLANGGAKLGLSVKGFLSKIKDKFPGQYTKAENQEEFKDKTGTLNNRNNNYYNDNEKLPEGYNKDEEKQKEN